MIAILLLLACAPAAPGGILEDVQVPQLTETKPTSQYSLTRVAAIPSGGDRIYRLQGPDVVCIITDSATDCNWSNQTVTVVPK